ncbi:MAG: hypothetical protein COB85_06385 [Bacteroidetes bacterium]|nr:MAG: hypothetical protein COB85_06385 [Bacteroidota bacterium]
MKEINAYTSTKMKYKTATKDVDRTQVKGVVFSKPSLTLSPQDFDELYETARDIGGIAHHGVEIDKQQLKNSTLQCISGSHEIVKADKGTQDLVLDAIMDCFEKEGVFTPVNEPCN